MSDYQAKDWKNYSNTSTPITAADMNRIDSGVAQALEAVENVGGNFDSKIDNAKDAVINEIDAQKTAVVNEINNAESYVLSRLVVSPNITLEGKIDSSEAIIRNKIDEAVSTVGDKINDSDTTVVNEIGAAETRIKTAISGSGTAVLNKFGNSETAVDIQISTAKTEIIDRIGTPVNGTVSKDITALSDELKTLKEYIEDKHNETFDEMRKTKLEIIRACVDLADEMSPWRGVVSGRALEIPTVGICVKSYIYTAEEK